MFHMVTLFPNLLNYSFYAPLLLRIVLGLFAFSFGLNMEKKGISESAHESTHEMPQADPFTHVEIPSKKHLSSFLKILFFVCGVLVFIGFFTQLASIILAILFVIAIWKRQWVMTAEIGRMELILLITIAVALTVLPAGPFAIDYPL